MKKIFLYFFLSVLILIGCKETMTTLPFFNSAEMTPEWIDKTDSRYKDIHTIRPFTFTNQNNEVVTNETFDDHIYVTDFFFTTCPSICPKMTESMLVLQEEFKNNPEILLLSHSVTPWMDTVEQLKRYANDKGVDDSKWHLVTGEMEEIYNIARKSYFADGKIGMQISDDEFLHTENFILVDKSRRIRGIYNGTMDLDITRLIEDLDILCNEID